MKRFIIFLLTFLAFIILYNFQAIEHSLLGAFGDYFYKNNDFLGAEKKYTDSLKSLSGSTFLEADILYNLGNTLYKLGEKKESEERIQLWEESVGKYTKSLAIRIDPETEQNLAFVKEKLTKERQEQEKKKEEEKQKEQEKKKEEQKSNSGSKDTKEQSQSGTSTKEQKQENQEDTAKDKKTEKKNTSENGKQKTSSGNGWSNAGNYNPIGGQNKDNYDSHLSDGDKEDLKQYLQQLRQFEKENGKFLNPEKPNQMGGISDQIRNFFGDNSFFQDVLPSNDGKKDW